MERSLARLVDGIRRFEERTVLANKEFYRHLADGQRPIAMVIACSDSRVDPQLFLQTQPGELFVMRNAGNIVPPYGLPGSSEAATIEFALQGLNIPHLIVCGHTHCGAMTRLMSDTPQQDLPAVTAWIGHAESVRRIVHSRMGSGDSPDHIQQAVQENVVQQLQHLRTHPTVAERLANQSVMLHGWVYEIETGHVLAYEPTSGAFVPFGGHLGCDPAI
ncbi:MAG: carbonic anhydrase [Phycisphaerae bacterium]|nr:carbonic anhydrase [Phycisphaerae bacterium]